MKNSILKSCLVACVLLVTISCSDDDNDNEVIVNPATLPDMAKTFLVAHFPNVGIRLVEKQHSARPNGSVYDVSLVNGFEVDFDATGNWTEVDGGIYAVPLSIIPEKISTYVTTNYPNIFIRQIENEKTKYDVELSNDLDLVFTPQGDFVSIDN